ncbi:hypothetical protein CDAR_78331 [Caerostris darwini]|uniref:Secreted protein n=1 Tax=Caerostris darwini TaxID=1538125 RepID=A0AAV4SH03_9ARAC|nr:hypothetical protein CDAR_78331 [Caerostris darwini]
MFFKLALSLRACAVAPVEHLGRQGACAAVSFWHSLRRGMDRLNLVWREIFSQKRYVKTSNSKVQHCCIFLFLQYHNKQLPFHGENESFCAA